MYLPSFNNGPSPCWFSTQIRKKWIHLLLLDLELRFMCCKNIGPHREQVIVSIPRGSRALLNCKVCTKSFLYTLHGPSEHRFCLSAESVLFLHLHNKALSLHDNTICVRFRSSWGNTQLCIWATKLCTIISYPWKIIRMLLAVYMYYQCSDRQFW